MMIHRHRLFAQIYLSYILITVLCLVGAAAAIHHHHGGPPPFITEQSPPPHLWTLLIIAGLVALGTYPLARGITRRLEALRIGVEELGGGDLAARVPVRGRDEVAALARSFNASADRIQALVESQQAMLANASHELRSPLARLRLSAELLAETDDDAMRREHLAEAVRNVEELDRLVEDLLLVGRLEARVALVREPVDLLALAAEEASRTGGEVTGIPVEVQGDTTLLRAMLRNLLENAHHHGKEPVEIHVTHAGELARVVVTDGGPGVPAPERERIFEPFQRGSDAEVKGAGLGLTVVQRAASRHGGEARCEEGPGGRFVVEIPSA